MRGSARIAIAGSLSAVAIAPAILAGVPVANCSFDYQCRDDDPCTLDQCVMATGQPVGSGVCSHSAVAEGQPGDCDDGIFCNGLEHCAPLQGGGPLICASGPPATCCEQVCGERGRCSAASNNEGELCDNHADCPGGKCDHCPADCRVRKCSQESQSAGNPCDDDADCPAGYCLTADESCADDSQCNGAETCDLLTGLCRADVGGNVCGPGAICFDRACVGGAAAGMLCRNDAVCEGGSCQPAAVVCAAGRCCSQSDPPACSQAAAASCPGHWYAGDGGYEDPLLTGPCGGHDRFHTPGAAYGCPLYTAGVMSRFAQSVLEPPAHPGQIGPVSLSSKEITIGSYSGPLNAIGDDYQLFGPYGVDLEVLRFVGGCEEPGGCGIVVEFYDADENFVGRVGPVRLPIGELRTHVIPVHPRIPIPVSGFVVFRAPALAGGSPPELYVMSTDDVDVGSGSPDVLWLNDGAVSNFLPESLPGVLAFELVGDRRLMPVSACCEGAGVCQERTPWACAASGGASQEQAHCAQCIGGEWDGNNCRTCQGGSEPGNEPCTGQADCDARGLGGSCMMTPAVCAGSGRCSNDFYRLCDTSFDCPAMGNRCDNADQFCLLDSDCPGAGICGGAGTCLFGTCVEAGCSAGACCAATGECDVVDAIACQAVGGDFLGLGTSCDPNCCTQPNVTGADQPASAVVHEIDVPIAGAAPVTITITGSNAGASNTTVNPDSCQLFASEEEVTELGWWEAFSIDACANVRVDFCCSTPARTETWAFLAADPQCGTTVWAARDPGNFGEAEAGIGAPYCVEASAWQWFPNLAPGTYYVPIRSSPAGPSGPYQLHFTANPCATAACCLQNASDPDYPCASGLTAEACESREGVFLGPPNRYPPVPACTAGICDVGACCLAPGACADAAENGGGPMTRATCEAAPFSGSFVPHLLCEGGRCELDNDLSCSEDSDCAPFSAGRCLGGPEQLGLPPLCAICDHKADRNCQNAGLAIRLSDTSTDPPARVADDFSPLTSGLLKSICVTGAYDGPAGWNCQDQNGGVQDEFTVRVFASDEAGTLPGQLLGTFATTIEANRAAPFDPGNNRDCFEYQLQLVPDGQNPLPFLMQAEAYFLEVTNSTPGGHPQCFWHWLQADEYEGNGYAFADRGFAYDVQDAGAFDMAFCANLSVAPPPLPGGPVRACCTADADRPCEMLTVEACRAINGRWHAGDLACGPLVCLTPVNDKCDGAVALTEGPIAFDNFAAGREGPSQETCNGTTVIEGADLWFAYTATCTGTARLSTCHPDYAGEHVLSVYHTAANPTACLCPDDPGFALLTCSKQPQPNHVHPAGCPLVSAADLTINVTQGHCYTIRISGELATTSPGALRITCGEAACGNGIVEGGNGEQCDGTDDSLCPGSCDADCRCPVPVCGDGVAAVGLGEDCDGDDDEMCPGNCLPAELGEFGCKCAGGCGNGVREPGEQCDEPDDELCPGQCQPAGPGGCMCISACGDNLKDPSEDCDGTDAENCPGACNVDCTCPPPSCGNEVVEPLSGEECDGSATFDFGALCDPVECRLPGDPAGECTCKCPIEPLSPPPITLSNFGTCTGTNNPVCDLVANVCPAGQGTCERCNQVRYMGFFMPDAGGVDTALRFRMSDLHSPAPPPAGSVPNFALVEGQDRYLNTIAGTLNRCCNPNSNPTSCNTTVNCNSDADCVGLGLNTKCEKQLCQDSPAFGTFFRCARLGCTPEYRNWSDFSSGILTYLTGEPVIPSSSYMVAHLAASCAGNEAACAAASAEVGVITERWGNVDCSNGNSGIPAAGDIGRVVDKVKDAAGAFIKPRSQLREAAVNPQGLVNAQDIARIVDAVRGLQYPFNINCSATCANNAQCGPGGSCVSNRCVVPPACTTTTDCTNLGLSASHTCSANGRCTTVKELCTGLCQQ